MANDRDAGALLIEAELPDGAMVTSSVTSNHLCSTKETGLTVYAVVGLGGFLGFSKTYCPELCEGIAYDPASDDTRSQWISDPRRWAELVEQRAAIPSGLSGKPQNPCKAGRPASFLACSQCDG